MLRVRKGVAILAVQLALFGVIVGLGEIVSRVAFDPTPLGTRLSFNARRDNSCLIRSTLLGSEHARNCSTDGRTKNSAFSTNSLGLRDHPVLDDGRIRIVCLGDSSTFGWRVRLGQSYPKRLERILEAKYPGRYRVINAGTPGYTSYHGLRYLEARGLNLNPAVVIVSFGWNDVSPGVETRDAIAEANRLHLWLEFEDRLRRHSSLFRWARGEGRTTFLTSQPHRVPLAEYRQNFEKMSALARANDANILILQMLPPSPYPEELKGLGLPIYNYAGPKLDLIHPTPQGYRLLANAMLGLLEDEGYVGAIP